MSLEPSLRALLVCPRCRGELEDRAGGLWCAPERLWFPVEDGVPYLVAELARSAPPVPAEEDPSASST